MANIWPTVGWITLRSTLWPPENCFGRYFQRRVFAPKGRPRGWIVRSDFIRFLIWKIVAIYFVKNFGVIFHGTKWPIGSATPQTLKTSWSAILGGRIGSYSEKKETPKRFQFHYIKKISKRRRIKKLFLIKNTKFFSYINYLLLLECNGV